MKNHLSYCEDCRIKKGYKKTNMTIDGDNCNLCGAINGKIYVIRMSDVNKLK